MGRFIVTAATAVALLLPAATRAEGFGVSLQGEVGYGMTARDLDTDGDLVYGAILGLHFSGPLGLELAYQHAENNVSGVGGLFRLKQNGLLGHVRLDLSRATLVPFVYTGVGWVHYYGAPAASTTEDRVVIPVGAGLEIQAKPLVVGARGEYQWNTEAIGGKNVDYWKVVGTVGFQF
jgi:opacity protein-like surface antigen